MSLLLMFAIAAANLGVGLGPSKSQRLFASIADIASSFHLLGPGSEEMVIARPPNLGAIIFIELGRVKVDIEKRLSDVAALVLLSLGVETEVARSTRKVPPTSVAPTLKMCVLLLLEAPLSKER